MSEKGHNPYNNDPFKKVGQESDTIDFNLSPEEANDAERTLYQTFNYDGPDKDKLNSTMASLRKEEDDKEYKKAA